MTILLRPNEFDDKNINVVMMFSQILIKYNPTEIKVTLKTLIINSVAAADCGSYVYYMDCLANSDFKAT